MGRLKLQRTSVRFEALQPVGGAACFIPRDKPNEAYSVVLGYLN